MFRAKFNYKLLIFWPLYVCVLYPLNVSEWVACTVGIFLWLVKQINNIVIACIFTANSKQVFVQGSSVW